MIMLQEERIRILEFGVRLFHSFRGEINEPMSYI